MSILIAALIVGLINQLYLYRVVDRQARQLAVIHSIFRKFYESYQAVHERRIDLTDEDACRILSEAITVPDKDKE